MVLLALKSLLVCAAALLLLGLLRSLQLKYSSDQKLFLSGTAPSPAPNGFYQGSVSVPRASWLGKTFDAAQQSGENEFNSPNDARTAGFPFKTYVGQGLTDPSVTVLKIDYNVPEEPWWMHPVLDEIVQTSPEHYLGKMQLRIIHGLPFTLLFFRLQR